MSMEKIPGQDPIELSSQIPDQPQEATIKNLYGHCYEISDIKNNDVLPVGGNTLFSGGMVQLKCDFENLQDFLSKTKDMADKVPLDNLKEWLNGSGLDVDEKLFANLYAFTKEYESNHPDGDVNEALRTRREFYADGNVPALSELMEANATACAERAALAQAYLQQQGIASKYFSGDLLKDRDREFSTPHSFIIVRNGNRQYIYDPTNPTDTNQGWFPSLYTTEAVIDEEFAKDKKVFLTSKNIISGKEQYYGMSDGTNIIPERDII